MEKKDIDIGNCLYYVPEYEGGRDEIAYVMHLDGGQLGCLGNSPAITVDSISCEGVLDDMPTYADKYDVVIDSEYYFRVLRVWREFCEAFDIVSHKMQDFSYGLWAHQPGCDIEWKGDVHVGDTFMCLYGKMRIAKITREVGSGWKKEKNFPHSNDDRRPPFGADEISATSVHLDTHVYKSFLIHPIPSELWDEAYAAYMKYKAVWDEVESEICERYGLPAWRKRDDVPPTCQPRNNRRKHRR